MLKYKWKISVMVIGDRPIFSVYNSLASHWWGQWERHNTPKQTFPSCPGAGPEVEINMGLLLSVVSVSVCSSRGRCREVQFLSPHFGSDVGSGFSTELDSKSSSCTHLLWEPWLLSADFICMYFVSMHSLRHSFIQVYVAQQTVNLFLLHLG